MLKTSDVRMAGRENGTCGHESLKDDIRVVLDYADDGKREREMKLY